ncbi:sensor histidine kinase [Paenibacillus sp. JCM 10914]|uniref:sensor histidine kinase n=1 Tax=Paenibacillus sp. JCM 10914 TaxID=1236974 RepID=UPI0003CC5795|nr:sensor histidine kinase [Paenibacillus sp. JCM 10914]GAE06423.1 sensor histidine kinase [Paenibacillus sp. JCM 10914]
MFYKLYPRDQIKSYLLVDVVLIVFLCYRVFRVNTPLGIWGSIALLLLLFASLYVALWRRQGELLIAVLCGLMTIAVLSVFTGPSTLLFGIMFADLLGRSYSMKHIVIGSSAIPLSYLAVFYIRQEPFLETLNAIYLPVMVIQMVFPFVIHIREKAKNLQGELDEANEQIAMYIQQEERRRIARDLHDTLGQTLMMIKMKSELATRWVDRNPAQAKREIGEILDSSRIALKQVRELVSEMKFISLTAELAHVEKLLHTAEIELTVQAPDKLPLLSSVEETMLALCVREATTNIIKHSRARHAIISLNIQGDTFAIHIVDDGVGFHVGAKTEDGGNGIPSIIERMKSLDGSCAICPSREGGTKVSLRLPLHSLEKEDAT